MGIMDQMRSDKALKNLPNLTLREHPSAIEGKEKGYPTSKADYDGDRWNARFNEDVSIVRANLYENDDETFNFSLTLRGTEAPDTFRVSARLDPAMLAKDDGFLPRKQREELGAWVKFAIKNELVKGDFNPDATVAGYAEAVREVCGSIAGNCTGWTVHMGIEIVCYEKDGEMKGPYAGMSFVRDEPVEKDATGDLPY